MLEQQILGATSAELMDILHEKYDDIEDATISEVMVIVLVKTPTNPENPENESEDGWSMIHYRASEPSWTHQYGLLHGCLRMFGDA